MIHRSVPIFIDISVMVVQDENESGIFRALVAMAVGYEGYIIV